MCCNAEAGAGSLSRSSFGAQNFALHFLQSVGVFPLMQPGAVTRIVCGKRCRLAAVVRGVVHNNNVIHCAITMAQNDRRSFTLNLPRNAVGLKDVANPLLASRNHTIFHMTWSGNEYVLGPLSN